MASTSRRKSRYVFDRGPDGQINPRALPRLVLRDGELSWDAPKDQQRATPTTPTPPPAAAELAPLTASDQALIAANRARLAQLKSLPQGVDDPDFGELLHLIARRAAPDVALTVAGLALGSAGLVPIALWEAAVTAVAGAAGLTIRLRHRRGATDLLETGSATAEQLWRAQPGFVMAIALNILHATVQAATIDDTELEDELDAYYPRWSRTDFEFDPRYFTAWPAQEVTKRAQNVTPAASRATEGV